MQDLKEIGVSKRYQKIIIKDCETGKKYMVVKQFNEEAFNYLHDLYYTGINNIDIFKNIFYINISSRTDKCNIPEIDNNTYEYIKSYKRV